jgi:ribosomal protein S18 acetylase RimI-like enzyme
MTAATRPRLTRRPLALSDDRVARAMFAESRDDLDKLPAGVRESLLEMQYRAQQRQIAADHPNATHQVLVLDGTDVGRLVLAADHSALIVVDLVVVRPYRRRGVATAALAAVLADAGARPVRLHVWSENVAARALYERLGFVALSDGKGHIAMERAAS